MNWALKKCKLTRPNPWMDSTRSFMIISDAAYQTSSFTVATVCSTRLPVDISYRPNRLR